MYVAPLLKKNTTPLATQKILPHICYTWYLSLRIRASDSRQLKKRKENKRQKRKEKVKTKAKKERKEEKKRQEKKTKQGKGRKKKHRTSRPYERTKDGVGLIYRVSSA